MKKTAYDLSLPGLRSHGRKLHFRFFPLGLIFLFFTHAVFAQQNAQPGGVIKGQIVDSATGAGMEGVTISLGARSKTRSDKEGNFSIQAPGTQPVILHLTFVGYREAIALYNGANGPSVIRLQPSPGLARLDWSQPEI